MSIQQVNFDNVPVPVENILGSKLHKEVVLLKSELGRKSKRWSAWILWNAFDVKKRCYFLQFIQFRHLQLVLSGAILAPLSTSSVFFHCS